jgi:hypothetical protein
LKATTAKLDAAHKYLAAQNRRADQLAEERDALRRRASQLAELLRDEGDADIETPGGIVGP